MTLSFMVIAKIPGKPEWIGQGSRSFAAVPRIGEMIEMEENENGILYRIVSIAHPIRPASRAGDIYVVKVGPTLKVLRDLFNSV